MNTESLQNNFRSIYEDFFAKNDLVVSGNFSFSRDTLGIGHRSQHLRLKSKLPIKLYIGINKNTNNKVSINNVITYDISLNKFKEEKFSDIHKQESEIIAVITNFLKEKGIEHGISVSILTEDSRGHGLGFSGTFGSILSTGLHIMVGDLKANLLDNHKEFECSDVFKRILFLGQQIDFIARHKNLGVNSIYPLLTSELPYIFYSERFDQEISIDDLGSIKYKYFPLSEIFEDENYMREIPLDIAIIFSGHIQKTDIIEHSMINDEKKCNELSSFIQEDLIGGCDFKKDTSFHKFSEKGSIYEQLGNTASIMGIKMFYLLKKIYSQGFDTENINDFIDQINVLRNMLSLVEKQEDFADDILYTFKSIQSSKPHKIGVKPIYSGKNGGGYMLVMKEGESRQAFEQMIHTLKEKNSNIAVIHASWIDGKSGDGVKLHQYISGGLFSQYINKNQVFIKTNFSEGSMGDYNEIISTHQEGLLLDTIKNKIYLDGRKLNSTDIPSQTTTVALLDKLLDNIGKDMPNTDLDISSYSKNKNEMIGKIIIPLIELLDKHCNYKLPLICKGSIYDFYVKLNPVNLKIAIIKKIQ